MKQHCYLHAQYQETCRGCRLAARYATAHESALSDTVYNTAREDDDTTIAAISTLDIYTTITDISSDSSSSQSSADTSSDSSSSSDSFGGFDGGSSGGGGSDF